MFSVCTRYTHDMDTTVCRIDDCEKRSNKRGMCNSHYAAWRRENGARKCTKTECDRSAVAKGLCENHYRQLRQLGSECEVDGCNAVVIGRGWCATHYSRWQRTGDPGPAERFRNPAQPCKVVDCENMSVSKGFCATHRRRVRLYGNADGTFATTKKCIGEGCSLPAVPSERSSDYCRDHFIAWIKARVVAGESLGKTSNPNGYVYINIYKKNYAEHAIIMEARIGRPLWPDESVHHKNGQRSDNRPENLELWSSYQPKGQRVEDKIAYAREILARYT